MSLLKNIVFLGAPGSGKGTVSSLLSDFFGIPHLSTGDMFRTEISSGTRLGKRIKKIVETGSLVDDDTVAEIVMHRLSRDDCVSGFILDGYPRTMIQVEKLDILLEELGKKIDFVVQLDVSNEQIITRLSGRRTCSKCKTVFNINTISEDLAMQECRLCGGELIQREDDKPETIKKRLKIYDKEIAPLKKVYAKRNILIKVNGEGFIDEVVQRVKERIS